MGGKSCSRQHKLAIKMTGCNKMAERRLKGGEEICKWHTEKEKYQINAKRNYGSRF